MLYIIGPIFFEDYINLCHYELDNKIPRTSETITSDDVFNFMLDLRSINNGISSKREELLRSIWKINILIFN